MRPQKTKEFLTAEKEAYKKKPNWNLVFEKLQEAEKKNDPHAFYAIATWHLFGKKGLVKRDIKKGAKLLQKAAERDHPSALYDLAVCYEKGKGVNKSLKRAFEYYMAAALAGDAQSHYEVGRMYYWGIGIRKNSYLADRWLDKAEELGITDKPKK